VHVCEVWHPELDAKLPGPIFLDIADRDELRTGNLSVTEKLRMSLRDPPTPHECKTKHSASLYGLFFD